MTTKKALYAVLAIAGLTVWTYYSGIATVCSCVEGAVCDCTDYAIEATEMTGMCFPDLGSVCLC